MNERDAILSRIREALSVPAPVPGSHGAHAPAVSESAAAPHIPEWLPAAGGRIEDRIELFRTNSANLKTDFRLLDSKMELTAEIAKIAKEEGWDKVASHRDKFTGAACGEISLPVCFTDDGYDVNELESCNVGITACDALIAQTGSVLVTSRSAGGRALSVLPPHHIVLARLDQLLPDLPAAFALIESNFADDYPSFISLITGPSRTGDIERTLVLGAHGPKKLTVFCIAD